jgi:hypothetical protein
MADTADLESAAKAWGFKSLWVHQSVTRTRQAAWRPDPVETGSEPVKREKRRM